MTDEANPTTEDDTVCRPFPRTIHPIVGNITGPSIGPVTLTFSQPEVLLIRIL